MSQRVRPEPDEFSWGLPVWRRGDYEIVGDTEQLQFVVMHHGRVVKVYTDYAVAASWIYNQRKEGR